MTGVEKLKAAMAYITKEQEDAKAQGKSIVGMCSKTTRLALQAQGFKYPQAGTALMSHALMARNPAKYGWKETENNPDGTPPIPSLVYFNGANGYGHVGIAGKDSHGHVVVYSDLTRPWSEGWHKRQIGCYVPIA